MHVRLTLLYTYNFVPYPRNTSGNHTRVTRISLLRSSDRHRSGVLTLCVKSLASGSSSHVPCRTPLLSCRPLSLKSLNSKHSTPAEARSLWQGFSCSPPWLQEDLQNFHNPYGRTQQIVSTLSAIAMHLVSYWLLQHLNRYRA
jgi:hypothetical protein